MSVKSHEPFRPFLNHPFAVVTLCAGRPRASTLRSELLSRFSSSPNPNLRVSYCLQEPPAMDCGSDQELVTTGNFPAGPSAATVMDAGAVAAVTAAGGRGLATMLQRAANISSPPPEPAAPTPSGPPPDGGNQAPGRGPQERPASENRVGMPPSAATYCSYPSGGRPRQLGI